MEHPDEVKDKQITVLYVEDEPSLAELLRVGLGLFGMIVRPTYCSAEELLSKIGSPEFAQADILFLDIRLPGLTGLELAKHLRTGGEARPIVVVSAYFWPDSDVLEEIHAVFQPKPFNFDELVRTITCLCTPPELRDQEQHRRRQHWLLKEIETLSVKRNQLREIWQVAQVDTRLAQLIDEFASLASGVIHDLRSAIGIINTNVQILLRGIDGSQPWFNEFDRIARVARYCELLVENLSETRSTGRFQPFALDPKEPVQEVLSLIRGKNPDMELVFRIERNLPKVDAVAIQLKQVLLNVLRAILETRTEASGIAIAAMPLNGGACLEIAGIGLEISPTLDFNLDTCTKRGSYNTELYIAKKLASRHNGTLYIKAAQGEKCGFTLWLPAAQEQVQPLAETLMARKEELEHEVAVLEQQIADKRPFGEPGQLAQEIGKLVGDIVADLFSELGIIENTAIAVLRAITQENPLYERLYRVSRACEYSRLLARNLLSLGTGEEPALQPVDIEQVLREVVGILGSKILPNIEQLWRVDTAKPKVLGDELGLKQIFMNLVMNALEAMPQNKPGKLHIRIEGEANWVIVEIIDNGRGISPANQSRIFDLHFTTKPHGEGGIGLYVVKSVVEQLHGTIKVYSQEGQRTRFTVRLPAAREA